MVDTPAIPTVETPPIPETPSPLKVGGAMAAAANQAVEETGDIKSVTPAAPADMPKPTTQALTAASREGFTRPEEIKVVERGQMPPADLNPMEVAVAKARAYGYSWEDITTNLSGRIAKAQSSGYTEDQIGKALGFKDPAELIAHLQKVAAEREAMQGPTAPLIGANGEQLPPYDVRKAYADGLLTNQNSVAGRICPACHRKRDSGDQPEAQQHPR